MNYIVYEIMAPEIVLRLPLWIMVPKLEIYLTTGELVEMPYSFRTKRLVNGRYVTFEDSLFCLPLKPGDYYITEVSNVEIRFYFMEEHLSDRRGQFYFYCKHLEKLGLVSISPGMKVVQK